jgi:hypothetical protein
MRFRGGSLVSVVALPRNGGGELPQLAPVGGDWSPYLAPPPLDDLGAISHVSRLCLRGGPQYRFAYFLRIARRPGGAGGAQVKRLSIHIPVPATLLTGDLTGPEGRRASA